MTALVWELFTATHRLLLNCLDKCKDHFSFSSKDFSTFNLMDDPPRTGGSVGGESSAFVITSANG